jgi:hypothetical protein
MIGIAGEIMTSPKRFLHRKLPLILRAAVFLIVLRLAPPAHARDIEQMGDVDGSGGVNVGDVILILRNVVGIEPFNTGQQDRADMTGDGRIDVSDATCLLGILVGLANTPCLCYASNCGFSP